MGLPARPCECAPRQEERRRRTVAVRTVRVELAALVALRDVDFREVAHTSDLNVVRSLDEVRASDGALGHDACAVAGLDTPGDLDALRVADDGVRARLRRGKDAEIVYCVNYDVLASHFSREFPEGLTVDVLAHRALTRPRAALVRARLALLGLGRDVRRQVRRAVRLPAREHGEREGSKDRGVHYEGAEEGAGGTSRTSPHVAAGAYIVISSGEFWPGRSDRRGGERVGSIRIARSGRRSAQGPVQSRSTAYSPYVPYAAGLRWRPHDGKKYQRCTLWVEF